jgi:hypothetical protein
MSSIEENDRVNIHPISGQPQEAEENFDETENKIRASQQDDENGLNPPTRRILIFTGLSIVAFSLFLASLFETLATPTKNPIGNSASEVTIWKSCSVNATTEKKSNCVDPATSASYCEAAQNVIMAIRAFIIITIVSCVAAATIGISTFIGAASIAKRVKGLSRLSAFCGILFGAITLGLQVGFLTRKVCDNWPFDSILKLEKSAGQSMYMVGAAIPLCVVGIALMLIAEILVVWGPVACLDSFYEPKECCDDEANGGNRRRQAL